MIIDVTVEVEYRYLLIFEFVVTANRMIYFSVVTGVLYHRWGKLQKAKESYERALALDPNSETTRENLAMLLRKLSKNS